jgi:hypothetical protein
MLVIIGAGIVIAAAMALFRKNQARYVLAAAIVLGLCYRTFA